MRKREKVYNYSLLTIHVNWTEHFRCASHTTHPNCSYPNSSWICNKWKQKRIVFNIVLRCKQMKYTNELCSTSKYFPSGPKLFVTSLVLLYDVIQLLLLWPIDVAPPFASLGCCGFFTPLTTILRASCFARTCRKYWSYTNDNGQNELFSFDLSPGKVVRWK